MMKKTPPVVGKKRTSIMMLFVTPIIAYFMGSLTFILAFVYGKDLRTAIEKNQKELRETASRHKKISLTWS
jgi:hypothetical protein